MMKSVYVVPKTENNLLAAVNTTIAAGTPTVCVTSGVTETSVDVWIVSPVAPHSKYEYLGDWLEGRTNLEIDLHEDLVSSGEPSCIIMGV